MYLYVYVCLRVIYVYVYVCVYIDIYRERERCCAPAFVGLGPPTASPRSEPEGAFTCFNTL